MYRLIFANVDFAQKKRHSFRAHETSGDGRFIDFPLSLAPLIDTFFSQRIVNI